MKAVPDADLFDLIWRRVTGLWELELPKFAYRDNGIYDQNICISIILYYSIFEHFTFLMINRKTDSGALFVYNNTFSIALFTMQAQRKDDGSRSSCNALLAYLFILQYIDLNTPGILLGGSALLAWGLMYRLSFTSM